MRRTCLRALPAAALVLSALAGCATEGDAETAATGDPATTAPTVSPAAELTSPTGSPSPSTADVIGSTALLQPEQLNGARLEPLPDGENAHLRPVRPCNEPYPSDATRTAAVAMRAYVSPGANMTPTVVLQYVGLHPTDSAAAFAEIAAAVRRCPGGLDAGERKWTVAQTGVAGDESLLVRASVRGSYGDKETVTTTPAVVARVDDYVLVVADLGWESASGDESYVRRLAVTAVERLRAHG